MNVALIYDQVNKFGGAERILLALMRIFPQAPLFTAVYDEKRAPWAKGIKIITSSMQKIPGAKSRHEFLPWLTPLAFESFNLDDFDLVISITSGFAKAVITKPQTLHLCYLLTPTRYLWSDKTLYFKKPGFGWLDPLAKSFFSLLGPLMREHDYIFARRPDSIIAISKTVADRIMKYYRRRTTVIHPPVDTDIFSPGSENTKEFYLVISRLVPYKRVDLVIKAFNQLGWSLVVIGKGSQLSYLKSIAKTNVSFLSDLTDEEMVRYYRNCRALVHAGIEDFGIVSLEAQACGRPVLAYGRGGFLETVVRGKTGDFFFEQNKDDLVHKLKEFNQKKYSSLDCRRNALFYSQSRFRQKFYKEVLNKIKEKK